MGIARVVLVRQISAMQVKKCVRKGCTLYVSRVLDSIEENKLELENFVVLREYKDVFHDEVPRLPPKREIDFIIDLTP